MKKITETFFAGCAKILKQAAKKDMREWPPSSVPIFYQPKRPMCDKPETQAED